MKRFTLGNLFQQSLCNVTEIPVPERRLLVWIQSGASGCTQIRTQETHAIERLFCLNLHSRFSLLVFYGEIQGIRKLEKERSRYFPFNRWKK